MPDILILILIITGSAIVYSILVGICSAGWVRILGAMDFSAFDDPDHNEEKIKRSDRRITVTVLSVLILPIMAIILISYSIYRKIVY